LALPIPIAIGSSRRKGNEFLMNFRKSQKVLALGNEVSVSFCRFSLNQKEREEAYFCLDFFGSFLCQDNCEAHQ